jgi:hypothetical protein
MAVKTNNKETAGPPLKQARPIVEKTPAPIIAATPKAVRSRVVRILLRDTCAALSSDPSVASSIALRLKSWLILNISLDYKLQTKKSHSL